MVMVRPGPLSAEASLLSFPDGVDDVTNKVVLVGLAVVVLDIFAIICSPRLKYSLYIQFLLFLLTNISFAASLSSNS